MFARSILLGGAVAVGASAMLVIPETIPQVDQVEGIEDDFVNILQPAYPDVSYAVMLNCDTCPFREVNEEGVVSWSDNKPSTLFVEFHMEENRLMANDHQIFPPVPPTPITAVQHARDGDEESNPMLVGYALEVTSRSKDSHVEEGFDVLDARFTILDLETHPVPVDTVAMTMILTPTGDLLLVDGEIDNTAPPAEKLSWKKCEGKPKCLQELLFDRVHGLLESAKDRFRGKGGKKGCHGKHGKHGKEDKHAIGDHHAYHEGSAMEFEDFKSHRPHHGFHPEGMPPFPPFHDFEDDSEHKGHHPHHHHDGDHFNPEAEDGRPHPHHHKHHVPPHGAFAHTFSRVVRFIVVPAILGVLAGLTASAVGMLVGQAVVFLWQRYRGTKNQEHKAAWEEGASCEKQGLMSESTEEEFLPEYSQETSETRASMDKN